MNYYNEFDPNAAAWLRELIAQKLIPDGIVDERSILEVQPHELTPYVQCHFFCGIGGWPLALQLAGWDPARPVGTGSCPCQPYSAAGKGLGDKDPRNLWPAFRDLIIACRNLGQPWAFVVFGEQVESAIGHGWLDGVSADMEREGYAVGAVVLGAHSILAPHIRQRLYWVAQAGPWMADTSMCAGQPGKQGSLVRAIPPSDGGGLPNREPRRLADSIGEGLQGHAGNVGDGNQPGRQHEDAAGPTPAGGPALRVDNAALDGCEVRRDLHREHDWEGSSKGRATGWVGDPVGAGQQWRDQPGSGAGGPEMAEQKDRTRSSDQSGDGCQDVLLGMGDTASGGLGILGHAACPRSGGHSDGTGGTACGMADTDGGNASAERQQCGGEQRLQPEGGGLGFWDDSRWIYCRDGKHRRIPTQSALFPLADGIPYKLARRRSIRPALLKGAGNAIVPQVAAGFIQVFLETRGEMIAETDFHPNPQVLTSHE